MSSMVLEMPLVAVADAIPQRDVVRAQLDTLYDARFAELRQQYLLVDERRILAFLRQHSHLVSVLEEGRAAINVIFGKETPVQLMMQRDPEIDMEYLIAWILTTLPAGEAVDRLSALGDAWFFDQFARVGDLLNFNLGVP